MSADNRTVHTDALATLGLPVIDVNGVPAARDAIHLAVEPAIAMHIMEPGRPVKLTKVGDIVYAVGCAREESIGIVDPFLEKDVIAEQKFWLILHPRTITSLRHVWTHPAFDKVSDIPPAGTNLLVKKMIPKKPKSEEPVKVKFPPDPPKAKIKTPKEMAETYLQDLADSLGVGIDELISHAEEFDDSGEYWIGGAEFEGMHVESIFWTHLANYTGKKYISTVNFLSCSC